ncbi:hypothetical protein Igag_1960 [Ignisphaera aggregans DSM 17230]|uniref:Uncharacterized protein n=1 Tax=Ignisphaera aggregans (strain DSM 17230 / JCM 13409 / AQ1.S1) TaxID=583356 RepID=E0STG6_IGNAA|nr:hypothetical protein Igag_1960 [Ignisphaera aggregans DSM 17230]
MSSITTSTDPRKSVKYRFKRFVKNIQVFLGLKSKERAEIELRIEFLEEMFVNAMIEAYTEITERLVKEGKNVDKDELAILLAAYR